MATPGERLANSLAELKKLQDRGIITLKNSDLSRVHLERLEANGFIRSVVKGWYITTSPTENKGDSTSWFTSFWEFCSRYLAERFGEDYCISAEQSVLLHAGNTAVPKQLIIRAVQGNNSATTLLFGTSILVMKSTLPLRTEMELVNGLRAVSLPSALIHCAPSVFVRDKLDVRTAMMRVQDASELLNYLLEGGHSNIAGRLVGAYRNIGRTRIAEDILKTMQAAGYVIREEDPFLEPTPLAFDVREHSPFVNRIRLMWQEMRQPILDVFPKPLRIRADREALFREMEDIYVTDAYHSLSIERYSVSPELIERVRMGAWNVTDNTNDKQQKNAMAARGYWQAFEAVKGSIDRALQGENIGEVLLDEHGDWYRELFGPSVAAGLLKPSDLAGYRNGQVYIGQSKHTPMDKQYVREVMPLLFDLIAQEQEACVRAILGHFVFVYTHPYMDGNGRMARFIMNAILVDGGYPWTVIPMEAREQYMSALEKASVEQDIVPFAEFVANLVKLGMEGRPAARI